MLSKSDAYHWPYYDVAATGHGRVPGRPLLTLRPQFPEVWQVREGRAYLPCGVSLTQKIENKTTQHVWTLQAQ